MADYFQAEAAFCADADLFVQGGLLVQSPTKSVNPFTTTASKRHNSP